jgi:nucleotide-binding universal stress UspA family protein
MEHNNTSIVVGVVPRQPVAVVTEAALFAERFDAELVCATVDTSRYTVSREPDGTVVATSFDPDLADETVEEFDPALRATIADVLDKRALRWSVRALAGNPAEELAGLADEMGAAMIVVGTREAGMRGSLHEFFNGSAAVQLAHRQHRPVVVVPLNPVGADDELPWTGQG